MQGRTPDFEVQITATSTDHFTEAFPAPDKLAVSLLVENTGGSSATISLTPQHSSDGGRYWIDKSALGLSPSSSAGATAITPMFAADDGSAPNMTLMRFKISATSQTPNIRGFLAGRTY